MTYSIGKQAMTWLDAAAECSEPGPGVTRVLGSPEHQQVLTCLRRWYAEAGADEIWLDAAGNLVGRWPGRDPAAKTLIVGSHQDTVSQGGRYDGIMGVLLPLAVLHELNAAGKTPETTIELVAFSDEEGTRFASTLVGSSAIAGCFNPAILDARDSDGTTLADALRTLGGDPAGIPGVARDPEQISGFLEVHIEQGPVLEAEDLPVGIVTAITGIERYAVHIQGKAGHAGTTPMHLRQDALLAASHVIQAVDRICRETDELVGVVGKLQVTPNAVNVIPSGVDLTIELRSPVTAVRHRSRKELMSRLSRLMAEQGVGWTHELVYEQAEVSCAPSVQAALAQAIEAQGYQPRYLFSGAGHDGLAMASLTDIGMLFMRCKDGLSHHPDESVTVADIDAAGQVMKSFFLDWPG